MMNQRPLIIMSFFIFLSLVIASQGIASQVTGNRDIPSTYSTDSSITVTLNLEVDEANKPNGVIIKDYVPAAWTVTSATPNFNNFDSTTGEVKWVFFGSSVTDAAMDITYQVSIPSGDCGTKSFSGQILYNDPQGNPVTEIIGGDTSTSCGDSTRAVTGTRGLPSSYTSGTSITVTVNLEVDEANKPNGVIVKDYVPTGWTVTSATPTFNNFDSTTGEVKWVFFGSSVTDTAMDITYQVSIPSGDCGTKSFSGQILYNDPQGNPVTDTIGGDTSTTCGGGTRAVAGMRDLPSSYTAGSSITVTLNLEVDEANKPNGVIVKDYVPSGWTVTSATPNFNNFDSTTGEVKWVFFGSSVTDTAMDISYQVSIPSGDCGSKTFRGEILYNDAQGNPVTEAIGGNTSTSANCNGTNVVQLNLSDGTGLPGGSVSTELTLLSAGFSVASFSMDIGYNISLLSNFRCTINPDIGPGTSTDKSCLSSSPSSGVFRVGILGFNNNIIPDGLVATISFDVASTATCDSTTNLTPLTMEASDPNGNAITPSPVGTDSTIRICGLSVTYISQDLGTTVGGCPVIVTGAGFQSGATLSLSGIPASSVNVASDSIINAVTQPGTAPEGSAPSPGDVVVCNPDGQCSVPSRDQVYFTYVHPGDINHNGRVNIPEVQTVINMYLTGLNIRPEADSNCDGRIAINEIQQAINSFLTLP